MKIIKKIFFGIAIIIGLLLVIAIFVPKHYVVRESITINKSKQEVYDYVRILKNQEQYSEWVKADPNLHPNVIGNDGEVGATQKWNSKDDNVGEGEQTITKLTTDTMEVDLHFIRPFEGTAKAANLFKSINDNQMVLTAEFYSNDKYPFNLMSYFVGRPMIKATEEKNLKNIKSILEK